ncbi:MAG: CsgG/HfaB family protein [Elusimicrobiota bacterium]
MLKKCVPINNSFYIITNLISYVILLITLFSQQNLYSQEKTKPTIAVVDFEGKNVSAAESAGISDLLRSEIVKSNLLVVIERNNMEMILNEQKFQLSGCTSQECAVKLGKILNVQKVVTGSVIKIGKSYYINISIVDVETAQIVSSDKIKTDSIEELADKTEELARTIVQRITEKRISKKKEVAISEEEKTKEGIFHRRFGIGIGNPYLSIVWNLSNKFTLEPRYADNGTDNIKIIGGRIYYNFVSERKVIFYTAIGGDAITFDGIEGLYGDGWMAFGVVGIAYHFTDRMAINIDIGPARINLQGVGGLFWGRIDGIEWIINTGMRFYLF